MRTDAELMRAARTDAGAFREIYDRYADGVYGFVFRRTGDPDAAHDLTAETFAAAWLSRARFRDRSGGLAGPWLFGIARNLIAQSVRRRRIELAACAKLGILERLDQPSSCTSPTNRGSRTQTTRSTSFRRASERPSSSASSRGCRTARWRRVSQRLR